MKVLIIILSLFIAGYAFAGETFDQNQTFMVASYPKTLAVGDLNRDKMDDIAVIHWAGKRISRRIEYYKS